MGVVDAWVLATVVVRTRRVDLVFRNRVLVNCRVFDYQESCRLEKIDICHHEHRHRLGYPCCKYLTTRWATRRMIICDVKTLMCARCCLAVMCTHCLGVVVVWSYESIDVVYEICEMSWFLGLLHCDWLIVLQWYFVDCASNTCCVNKSMHSWRPIILVSATPAALRLGVLTFARTKYSITNTRVLPTQCREHIWAYLMSPRSRQVCRPIRVPTRS